MEEQTEFTLGCNYYGVKNVSCALFPLLKPHARCDLCVFCTPCIKIRKNFRVVVVSSRAGALRGLESDEMKKTLLKENLSEKEIEAILDQYVQ